MNNKKIKMLNQRCKELVRESLAKGEPAKFRKKIIKEHYNEILNLMQCDIKNIMKKK